MSQSPMAYTDKNEEDRSVLYAEIARLRADLEAVAKAIGGVEFMDPPDGGSVTLAEQVQRMRAELDAAREAIMMLAPADEEDHWFNLENFDLKLWFELPAVQAACEGKR